MKIFIYYLIKEKDNIELQQRMSERELSELREKFALANRSLGNAHVNVASHETTISQLRGNYFLF